MKIVVKFVNLTYKSKVIGMLPLPRKKQKRNPDFSALRFYQLFDYYVQALLNKAY